MSRPVRIAVVGAGIVGLAAADALARRPGLQLRVVEAERDVATHQTGHNSGVIHAGLYYRPGSEKARLCRAGRSALLRFCEQQAVPHEVCGKLVVATEQAELPGLDELERRGLANGLQGLRRLGPEELREREPAARGLGGLLVPETGIVDFRAVAWALARRASAAGVTIEPQARLSGVQMRPDELTLLTNAGERPADFLLNCAGLHADRVARLCGTDPGVLLVPFRGEYQRLVPARRGLVRHLIYPVPDPELPFLGVHFTRTIDGDVEIGPNALWTASRHGYQRGSLAWRDLAEMLANPGFRRLARQRWRLGAAELRRSLSRRAGLAAMRKLVPELEPGDIERAGAGVRAQAVAADGTLVDDFHIVGGERALHVVNAPSPAATASLAIGEHLATRVVEAVGQGRVS